MHISSFGVCLLFAVVSRVCARLGIATAGAKALAPAVHGACSEGIVPRALRHHRGFMLRSLQFM